MAGMKRWQCRGVHCRHQFYSSKDTPRCPECGNIRTRQIVSLHGSGAKAGGVAEPVETGRVTYGGVMEGGVRYVWDTELRPAGLGVWEAWPVARRVGEPKGEKEATL